MTSHQRVNQDSRNVEYYTPPEIIEAARRTMGGIDLDPASCEAANRPVQAGWIYTEAEEGLNQKWTGNVWMNHPFKRGRNHLWINKLVEEYSMGRVRQACCITWASTSEQWFRPLLHYPQCFPEGRTDYLLPDGTVKKGATKGSVITYLGPNRVQFTKHFSKIGVVKIPLYYHGGDDFQS